MKKIISTIILLSVILSVTGCRKPYKTPILEDIPNNVTAYLINLEGDSKKGQAKFNSVEFLEKSKIATKRIEIEQRWNQTGRRAWNGKWIPSQKLLKVDRTPVAIRWTGDANTGTSKKCQLLTAESKDSIGVSSGFAITAMILEEDTSKYLYKYPGKDLSSVVNNQIFNDAQAVYSEVAAKYDVRDLRLHKEEINITMRTKLIPMYALDGITIKSSLGLIGGLVYDNPKIQNAIDTVFIAQTLEAKMEADRVAQIKTNEKDLAIEQNEAEKRKVKADAEAYEITSKAKAIKDGGDAYLELLRLEVERDRIAKWNGTVSMVSGGGGNNGIVVPVVLPSK